MIRWLVWRWFWRLVAAVVLMAILYVSSEIVAMLEQCAQCAP